MVEDTKARTSAVTETTGQEKAAVDEAVKAGREHEEAVAELQVGHAQCAGGCKTFCILHLLPMLPS